MLRLRSLFLSALAVCAYAQSDRGTLTGTVSDPGGAVAPGATVIATNPATAGEFRTESTGTGGYTIPSLPAGLYDLTVEFAEFRKHEQKGIRVQVARTARIDVTMQVGSTTARDQLNQLPLNFATGVGAVRNPLSFVQLSPGGVAARPEILQRGVSTRSTHSAT